MSSKTWYYVENDARIGPVEAGVIDRLIEQGAIGPDTFVWQDGMADWVAARGHFDFPKTSPDQGFGSFAPEPGLGRDTGTSGAAVTGRDGLYVGAPSRSFGEAISICFKKYVDFSGRASRSEYWFWALFTVLAGFVTGFIDGALFGSGAISPTNSLFSLATFLPGLAVGMRRLHDTNRSGWWIGGFMLAAVIAGGAIGAGLSTTMLSMGPVTWLLALAMIGYSIMLIVFFCQQGDAGPNDYG